MPNLLNGVWIVFRKELLDSLRERRAVIVAFVFGPLFGPILFAGIMGFTLNRQVDESLQPITVPAIGAEDAANLMDHMHGALINIEHRFADVEAMRDAVRRGDVEVGLVVDEDFATALRNGAPARLWIVADGSNSINQVAARRLRAALQAYNRIVGANRLLLRGVDPTVTQPLAILTDDVSTPSGRAIILLGMMTSILVVVTLLGGVQVAIDTTAGERERVTMEPLLTLPRATFEPSDRQIRGDLAVSWPVSLGLAIGSYGVAASFLPLAEIGMSANLGPVVCLRIYFVMLPFAVLGAAMTVMVASYAKSLREAQTYTSIALVVPMVPIVVVVMNPSSRRWHGCCCRACRSTSW